MFVSIFKASKQAGIESKISRRRKTSRVFAGVVFVWFWVFFKLLEFFLFYSAINIS